MQDQLETAWNLPSIMSCRPGVVACSSVSSQHLGRYVEQMLAPKNHGQASSPPSEQGTPSSVLSLGGL